MTVELVNLSSAIKLGVLPCKPLTCFGFTFSCERCWTNYISEVSLYLLETPVHFGIILKLLVVNFPEFLVKEMKAKFIVKLAKLVYSSSTFF